MLTILHLEDHPNLAEIVSIVLDMAGYRVVQAASVSEARSLIAAMRFDLYLLDHCIAAKGESDSGLNLCLEIRAIDRDTPILILTGDPRIDRERAISEGATDLMTKPFDNDDLIKRIGELLAS